MRKTADLTGKCFGRLTVIERTNEQEDRYWIWRCRCDCGKEIFVNTKRLTRGTVSHCGCGNKETVIKEPIPADLTGKRYGRLTVLRMEKLLDNGKSSWLCQCDCGNQCVVTAYSLHRKKRKSCGCLHRDLGKSPSADLSNKVFGRLTALHPISSTDKNGSILWKCRCKCGTEINVSQDSLVQGYFRSCGCVRQERENSLHECLTFVDNTCIEVLERRKSRSDNTSGFRGVSKGPDGKWLVTIGLQGKRFYIGLYSDFDYAVKARLHIENALHDGFVKAYQEWQRQAAEDPSWAETQPFFFDVVKSGSDFHINSTFGSEIISSL